MAAARKPVARKGPNPADLTGKLKADLAKEHAEEVKAAAARMAIAMEVAEEEKSEVIDCTQPVVPEVVEEEEVVVKDKIVRIQVNSKIEQMTYGRDLQTGLLRQFDFEPGRRYDVPADLALHLDEKGYLWH